MPPDAAPTYQMFGFPGTPATEVARLPSGPMYRYLSCPYTSGLTGGCCACNKAGATNNIATTIRTTYFAETNLSHVNMLDLSVELRKERADDTGGAAAGQCQRTERPRSLHFTAESQLICDIRRENNRGVEFGIHNCGTITSVVDNTGVVAPENCPFSERHQKRCLNAKGVDNNESRREDLRAR